MAEGDNNEAIKRTVLIPVDGSDNSLEAFEYYTKQILREGDRVLILHVFEMPHLPYSASPFGLTLYEEWCQEVKNQREGYKAMLKSYEDKLNNAVNGETGDEAKEQEQKSKIEHEIRMVVGKPAGEVICQVAKDEKVNLVVMGTRGQGVLRRTLMGSVSDYVIHHAHVPINVVPMPSKE